MPFVKYKVKDYAEGELLAGISTGALSLQLKSGQGAKFPAFSAGEKAIGTLEKRTGSVVTARERVTITARSTDTFTITRSFGGDTAIAFSADDYFCLHVNADIIGDMQDEISTKLASAGGLRTALTNWRLYYSNGSGAETELALGSANTYLKSNGATAIPTWTAPPLDINGQTTITPAVDDFVALYDISGGGNGKATTQAIIDLFTASNAQASTGSATNVLVTPLHLKKYYGPEPIAGVTYTAASISGSVGSVTSANGTYAQAKIGTIQRTGTYRISVTISAVSFSTQGYAKIYKNGAEVGAEQTNSSGSMPATVTWDLAYTEGQTISLWINSNGGGAGTVTFSDLSIKYDLVDQKAFTLS